MLLAKGSDFTALKIREIAVANDILLLESPALARSIFYSTDLDQEIPAGLYLAVAQVLAYVYQIRQYRAGRASGLIRSKTCRSRRTCAAIPSRSELAREKLTVAAFILIPRVIFTTFASKLAPTTCQL